MKRGEGGRGGKEEVAGWRFIYGKKLGDPAKTADLRRVFLTKVVSGGEE